MQICSCVGETISSTCPDNIPDEYIPLHFQKTTNENQVLLKYRCRVVESCKYFLFIVTANADTFVLLCHTGEITRLSV